MIETVRMPCQFDRPDYPIHRHWTPMSPRHSDRFRSNHPQLSCLLKIFNPFYRNVIFYVSLHLYITLLPSIRLLWKTVSHPHSYFTNVTPWGEISRIGPITTPFSGPDLQFPRPKIEYYVTNARHTETRWMNIRNSGSKEWLFYSTNLFSQRFHGKSLN